MNFLRGLAHMSGYSKRTSLMGIAVVLAACGTPTADYDARDDEAMQRARRENILPEVAAREWFYPKRIDDYFDGMDAVSVAIVTEGDITREIPAQEAYPHQLLDLPGAPTLQLVTKDVVDSESETLGRNTWMIWSGGNEAFWDWLSRQYGFLDFLKLLDSRNRATRFRDGGLINEPGMTQATSEDEFGLWLDQPVDAEVREWRRAYIRKAFNLDPDTGQALRQDYGSQPVAPSPYSMSSYATADDYNDDIPPPEIYGISSGIVGLRLFPNPNFDEEARERWDAREYYENPEGDPNLIRPYRVGMSCAFCHASYHPLNPPRDLVNPEWSNISGNIGAQYLRMQPVFGNLLPPDNFIYHILESQPPGTVDTSLVASDNINNPNAMNSVFNLRQRVLVSLRNPKEQLNGASSGLPAIWDFPNDAPSDELVALALRNWDEMLKVGDPPDGPPSPPSLLAEIAASNDPLRRVPRILFDGADSIGAWGALARVYLNIGMNSEQWNLLHEPVLGFAPQDSFTIDNVERHSVYWHATKLRVAGLRDYFLAITPSMPLIAAQQPVVSILPAGATEPAPDVGQAAPPAAVEQPPAQEVAAQPAAPVEPTPVELGRVDVSKLAQGRRVFAQNCIVCHSSVQPAMRHDAMAAEAAAADAQGRPGAFWDHDPGHWLSDPAYMRWALEAVEKPEFWTNNYLSTDYRIAVNYVGTNSCRSLATNAITGNMWEDFASDSYRQMPSVGSIPYFNPYIGERGGEDEFTPRHAAPDGAPPHGGGPGFYRVPTLVSIWSTAPFLHNNSLGLFNNDPSIEGRLEAFDDAAHKLLYPERRRRSSSYNGATADRLARDHGLIWRTTEESYLRIAGAYLPQILGSKLAFLNTVSDRWPWLAHLDPIWRPVPTGVLFLLAFFLLRWARGPWIRGAGYVSIVAGLGVGVLVYFLNGGFGGLQVGPIPKGTPVNLLANTNPDASPGELLQTLATVRDAFTEIESTRPDAEGVEAILRTQVAPALLAVSKCPDFVMDDGHYFEWFDNMTDDDKEALIELLKTF